MMTEHIEILVEEPSMEAFLLQVLPKIVGSETSFKIHAHQGKADLLTKLQARLRGYAKWLPDHYRVIVLVDRDDEDCLLLKKKLETAASAAHLPTRAVNPISWRAANRIVVEELEAWFFGAWDAVRLTYPRLPASIPNQAQYRDCDAVAGGTWEAFERVLQKAGYFSGGLRKVEVATAIGKVFNPDNCISTSFNHFKTVVTESVSDEIT